MIKTKQAREGDKVKAIMNTLSHPMQHPRSLIYPKCCPKLKDDLFIPILLKGHKGKNAPFFKLVNQSINLKMIQFLQGLEDHILVLKKGTILGEFAGFVEDRLIEVIMKLRPKPLLNSLKLDELVRVFAAQISQIHKALLVINTKPGLRTRGNRGPPDMGIKLRMP